MKSNRTAALIIAGLSMVLLIFDAKTALHSAMQGLDMCVRAVIPSLFPFFYLSAIINDRLLGVNTKLLRPLSRICKIPGGSESILLLGLIGGYPVGAACIHEAYREKVLSKEQASRMLSFCNNAGPAFLFGILAPVFENPIALWVLWGIHIFSALSVGMLLQGESGRQVTLSHTPSVTPVKAMQITLRNLSLVCGWIVLFRIIIGFFDRWFLWLLPRELQILLCGIIELSNGCLSLSVIPCSGLRFLFAAAFLSFGGICVCMQTASVIGDLPLKSYFIGKLLQTVITVILAGIAQAVLFPYEHLEVSVFLYLTAIFLFIIPLSKKAVAFHGNIGYNGRKSQHE